MDTQPTISGRAQLELAFGRRPPDLLDVETMDPEHLASDPLPPNWTIRELRRLAVQSHLKARQADELRHDLASRILPSEGPFSPGQHVFYWDKDSSKIKSQGRWKSVESCWPDGDNQDSDWLDDSVSVEGQEGP